MYIYRYHIYVRVLRILYTYVRTASRRRRAGAAGSPQSTQTESRGKDRVRTRRGQKVREVNGAEGCSTLAERSAYLNRSWKTLEALRRSCRSRAHVAIRALFFALDTRPRSKLSSKSSACLRRLGHGDDWILQSPSLVLRLCCMQGRLRARGIALRTLRIPSTFVHTRRCADWGSRRLREVWKDSWSLYASNLWVVDNMPVTWCYFIMGCSGFTPHIPAEQN